VPDEELAVDIANVIITDLSGRRIPIAVAPIIVSPRNGDVFPAESGAEVRAILPGLSGLPQEVAFFAGRREFSARRTGPYAAQYLPAAWGDVEFTVGVNTADGTEAFSLPVTAGFLSAGYLAWTDSVWGNPQFYDAATQSPSADPDGDGLSNFLERAFATNPLASHSNAQPKPGVWEENGQRYLSLTYREVKGATDLRFQGQLTPNFTLWQSGLPRVVEASRVDQGSFTEVTIRDTVPINDQERCFLRLNVATAPLIR
jgi:hypothetical protein